MDMSPDQTKIAAAGMAPRRPGRPRKEKPPPDPFSDAEHYERMQAAFNEARQMPGFINNCGLVAKIAAKELGVTLAQLQANTRGSRKWPLTAKRQKVMAFVAYVMRKRKGITKPASWAAIGRAVNRDHTTVLHAWGKYGGEIIAVLGE